MKKEKQKMEFSKKITITAITIFSIIMIYSMALMWKTDNTDALGYLITSASGFVTTCFAFYFWKAKMENVIKLSKENNISVDEVKDIESTLSDYDVNVESEEF